MAAHVPHLLRSPRLRNVVTADAATNAAAAAAAASQIGVGVACALQPISALAALLTHVTALVGRVLGLPAERVDPSTTLPAAGIDSLMAIELRRLFQDTLGATLPLVSLLRNVRVSDVARQLFDALAPKFAGATEQAASAATAPATAATTATAAAVGRSSAAATAAVASAGAAAGAAPAATTPTPSAAAAAARTDNSAQMYEPFTLSDLQQAYWIGRQAGATACHIYFEFRGVLDVARLSAAWLALLNRHPVLRAIVRSNGRMQVLQQQPAYSVPVSDLRSLTASEQEARLTALRERMMQQSFVTDKWPLWEVQVMQLNDSGDCTVHLDVDHLLCDLKSLMLLLRDWELAYKQGPAALKPMAYTYREYMVQLQQWTASRPQELVAAEAFWASEVRRLPPSPPLPYNSLREIQTRPHFKRHVVRIDSERWSAIRATGRSHGLTPSAIACAAYAEVLRRWSAVQQFTINLAVFDDSRTCRRRT